VLAAVTTDLSLKSSSPGSASPPHPRVTSPFSGNLNVPFVGDDAPGGLVEDPAVGVEEARGETRY
jgi:hypothetical protein